MTPEQDGRLGFADRATDAPHEAPAGLRPDGSVSTDAGHTPLPWEAASDGCLRRATPSGMDFLRIASPWVESAWNCDETAEANAAFIVRACNSHYELIEALSVAQKALAQVVEGDGAFVVAKPFRSDGVPCKSDMCAHGQFAHQGCATCADVVLDAALESIRAAIAKATGAA